MGTKRKPFLMRLFAAAVFNLAFLPQILSAQGMGECDFGFNIDRQSSAFQAMVVDGEEKRGFWLSINRAPPDVRKVAKFVGRLQVCLTTKDGKPAQLTRGGTTMTIPSPFVANCTAVLLPENRLLTNNHCYYDPDLVRAGFGHVQEARINFNYTSKDDIGAVQTYRVLPQEIRVDENLDALLLQVVGDPNTDLGGHIPMIMMSETVPFQELRLIHHPGAEPQQYSAGTCQVHRRQSEIDAIRSPFRHTCESMGGSSGSLLLDARTLAVVALHNQGGLSRVGESFNGGHKIAMINEAFDLGFEEFMANVPAPKLDPALLAVQALTTAMSEKDLGQRIKALKQVKVDFPNSSAALTAQTILATLVTPEPKPPAPAVTVALPKSDPKLKPTERVYSREIKLGILLGYTGPIESLTGAMAGGAEAAMAEVTKSGALLGGAKVIPVRGDTGCVDSNLAVNSAKRILAEGVAGIIGGDCSGVTRAILTNVTMPKGVVMISPSATSPSLSDTGNSNLFFRTSASDTREGRVMAEILQDRGVRSIAISYVNNDYGMGLAGSIRASFEALGGRVTTMAAHEDGRSDYSAEVRALAAAGGEVLVVAGNIDQGGLGIVRSALKIRAWDTFGLLGGMVGRSITDILGGALNGSFGVIANVNEKGKDIMTQLGNAGGYDGTSAFTPESYDAAALFMLAMQAAGSTDPAVYGAKIFGVANAPGEKIYPGELAKGLEILANGGEIDYVGASSVELIGGGESAGNYREVEVKDGKYETVKFH